MSIGHLTFIRCSVFLRGKANFSTLGRRSNGQTSRSPMPILVIALGIGLLLVLIMRFRINAFIALTLVSLCTGAALGMPLTGVVSSMEKGVGATLGSLAFLLGLGAMLGGLVAESGAARVIAERLKRLAGVRHLPWAMMLSGFIVGVPMFYTVAFLVVLPIIFETARNTRLPLLYVGIPMIAALSVTHGFLPPHPAPASIVKFYEADMQRTLVLGLIVAAPAIVLAGVAFGSRFRQSSTAIPDHLFPTKTLPEGQTLPSFGLSVLTALSPVLLMALAAAAESFLPQGGLLTEVLRFLGNPVIAMLLALLIGVYTLGTRQGRSLGAIMETMPSHVMPVAMIMLVIAGGGAFKQVLVDSGTSQYIVEHMKGLHVPPLLMAWSLAAALRIALGSATVAAITAAGMMQTLSHSGEVSPELLVLATGAGSLTCSQLNDTGFWLFKEYFGLSVTDTLKSWTVMETIVSVVGLAGVFVLHWLGV